MSGWYYMKEGLLDSSEKGPINDATLLQMAFDGTVKAKTQVRHEKHTGNQWAYLEQIPAAKKKLKPAKRTELRRLQLKRLQSRNRSGS